MIKSIRATGGRGCLALSGTCAVVLLVAIATQLPAADVETTVGMEGVYYARVTGPRLVAKPVDDDAPIVLRIADVVPDGSSTIYELRHIGALPGTYDLRDYLVRTDGEPLADVAPMEVTVRSVLPENHDGALEKLAQPSVRFGWPYRVLLAAGAFVWLLPLAWLLLRRIARRRTEPNVATVHEPTLADQLRPLVEEAVSGKLSSAEKARLERLLILHSRRQLDLNDCSAAEALRQMRRHPELAPLLETLDQWLYQRGNDEARMTNDEEKDAESELRHSSFVLRHFRLTDQEVAS